MKGALAFLFLMGPASADTAVVADWKDTFDRCRDVIEMGDPLRVDGLRPTLPEDRAIFVIPPQYEGEGEDRWLVTKGRAEPSLLWKSEGGGFWLAGWGSTSDRDGVIRRICDVRPVDPLPASDILAIQERFHDDRLGLVERGTHVRLDLDRMIGLTLSAFGPVDRSPTGFCVVSTMTIYRQEGDWVLTSGTGEQLDGLCSVEDVE
ncbi:MAG: hypothetical protein AAGE03_02590 [Pseudomonadota bacterium]